MDLSLLKIPEKVTSADFCPVHLVPSDKGLPIWIHKGVEYRGHAPDCQGAFEANPDELASSARYARWEKNFIDSMSIFWCPVTDEINPGGLLQWKRLGITWESCCPFCNLSFSEGDFELALKRLRARARTAYEKTGGKYVVGAASPIEGAIRFHSYDETEQADPASKASPSD